MTHELTDEREAFEAWALPKLDPAGAAHPFFSRRSDDDRYTYQWMQDRWEGWQARASLAHLAQRGTSETKDGIRILPAQAERVETGPVQFGDDWPGVFIRGDNAFAYCMALDTFQASPTDPLAAVMVQGLRDTLAGSDLTGLSKLAASPQAQPMPAAPSEADLIESYRRHGGCG